MTAPLDRLRHELAEPRHRLDRTHLGAAARSGAVLGIDLMPKLAIGLVLGFLGATVIGGGTPFSPWLLPLALPLVPLAAAAAAWFAQRRRPADSYDAALAVDRGSRSEDRVSTAVEFAEREAGGHEANGSPAFRAAAVDDGVQWIATHKDAPIASDAEVPAPLWRRAVAAVVIALLPAILPPPGASSPTPASGSDAQAGAPTEGGASDAPPTNVPVARAEPQPSNTGEPKPPAPADPKTTERVEPSAAAARAQAKGGLDTQAADTPASPSQSGEPKPAKSGAGASGSQGGGGQGQSSESAGEDKPAEQKPKPPSKKPKPQKPKPQNQREDSSQSESAPTPSGPSRGSGQMAAVANQKSGQDRGQERDDDPEMDEEEVEDEKEESEQRGGVMPMGRDRQTPPARELSISGDGPPQDGRGGPTPPKKSRGTASLVLGIQLPDHVRGQPNPGTAKTSIERTPPHGEPHAARPQEAAVAGAPTHATTAELRSPFASVVRRYHELWKELPATPAPLPTTETPR